MNNEEKSEQIAWNLFDDGLFYHNYESQKQEIQSAIMQMAEYKDSQYEQILIDKDCEIERLELTIEELKKGGEK